MTFISLICSLFNKVLISLQKTRENNYLLHHCSFGRYFQRYTMTKHRRWRGASIAGRCSWRVSAVGHYSPVVEAVQKLVGYGSEAGTEAQATAECSCRSPTSGCRLASNQYPVHVSIRPVSSGRRILSQRPRGKRISRQARQLKRERTRHLIIMNTCFLFGLKYNSICMFKHFVRFVIKFLKSFSWVLKRPVSKEMVLMSIHDMFPFTSLKVETLHGVYVIDSIFCLLVKTGVITVLYYIGW